MLEGLLAYEQATGEADVRGPPARRGVSAGAQPVPPQEHRRGGRRAFRQFSFPARWFYDVLRVLDYFRAAGDLPDARMAEARQLVRDKQQPDGTWLLENTHAGDDHFELEDGDGLASRWNTLRALGVLRWADGS